MQRLPIQSTGEAPMKGSTGCYEFPSDLKSSLVKLLKKVKFEEKKGVSKLFRKPKEPLQPLDDQEGVEGEAVKDYVDVSYTSVTKQSRGPTWDEDEDEDDFDDDVGQTPSTPHGIGFVGTHIETIKEVLTGSPTFYSQILRSLHEILNRLPEFSPKKVTCYGSGIGVNAYAVRAAWPHSNILIHCIEPSHQRMDIGKHVTEGFHNLVWSSELEIERNSAVRQLDPLHSKSSKDFYGELVLDTKKSTEPKTEVLETLEEQSDLVIVDLSSFSLPSDAQWDVIQRLKKRCKGVLLIKSNLRFRPYLDWKFSYVAFCHKSMMEGFTDRVNWGRIVSNPQKRKGHVILSLCNADGGAEKRIVAKSHGEEYGYRCARKSEWGEPFLYDKKPKSAKSKKRKGTVDVEAVEDDEVQISA
ncbi:hypothetical protein GUITHDRAFT_112447 [Guillardia theta CCMP2712]|uniref:Uncharacterized protein n=1 Tax=Guillardia theta (strain CCMP2712) TaxID=905079 RepID=L1IZ06_GUITC|nr:hypothetical protein GUITHDRAFT_112447 [Guillardia theta CCMP2712]EKX41476.1 hypothetical protein GUITHDRAFT_112447 [Guillardia theta CCMP2712]|eukprot:XP_005828456.1 hypothetical protein GUITHDRAFT_112447 [Guillardia theta CCMP2712]